MFFFVRSFWWNCTSQLYGIDASWQEERLKDEGTKYRRMKVWGGMREGDDQLIPEEKFCTSGWGTGGRERIGLGSSRSSNSASSRQFCNINIWMTRVGNRQAFMTMSLADSCLVETIPIGRHRTPSNFSMVSEDDSCPPPHTIISPL